MTLKPEQPKKGSVQKCREASNSVNQSVIGLLTVVGTRNTPGFQGAIQSKVNQVRSSLDTLRSSINTLPNIDTDIETQAQKIASLQEQLRLKNDFIMKVRGKRVDEMFPAHAKQSNEREGRQNEDKEMEDQTKVEVEPASKE